MAVTLLQAVQRVSRKVGLDPTITSFSNNDETNDLVQDIVEAYEDLLMALPPETPFLNASGALTLSNGTRVYSLASDAMVFDLYTWSFENETDNDDKLQVVTKDYVKALDSLWNETTGKPKYVYPEGNNQVGFYPIPDGTRTVNYQYGKTVATRISATSDTFIIPDRWVRFIEKRAQEMYERRKGFADPDATSAEAFNLFSEIMVEAWSTNPTCFFEEGLA